MNMRRWAAYLILSMNRRAGLYRCITSIWSSISPIKSQVEMHWYFVGIWRIRHTSVVHTSIYVLSWTMWTFHQRPGKVIYIINKVDGDLHQFPPSNFLFTYYAVWRFARFFVILRPKKCNTEYMTHKYESAPIWGLIALLSAVLAMSGRLIALTRDSTILVPT